MAAINYCSSCYCFLHQGTFSLLFNLLSISIFYEQKLSYGNSNKYFLNNFRVQFLFSPLIPNLLNLYKINRFTKILGKIGLKFDSLSNLTLSPFFSVLYFYYIIFYFYFKISILYAISIYYDNQKIK